MSSFKDYFLKISSPFIDEIERECLIYQEEGLIKCKIIIQITGIKFTFTKTMIKHSYGRHTFIKIEVIC